MKRILITGKNSYIGTNFEKWLSQYPDDYTVNTIDMRGDSWREHDFSIYDVVLHVAAIVHQVEEANMEDLYKKVNRDLPIEVAIKSKKAKVSQFIFLSTMSVYGLEAKVGQEVVIDRNTPLDPKSFYSTSKMEAEKGLNVLNDKDFKVVVLRPPMVYGPKCPGNYAILEKLATILPVFPLIDNCRSMIHIKKLCESIKKYIDNGAVGLFFPQDEEYVKTSIMIKAIAEENNKSIYLSKIAGWFITFFGRKSYLVNKGFGNLVYDKEMTE